MFRTSPLWLKGRFRPLSLLGITVLIVVAVLAGATKGATLAEPAQASASYDWPTLAHDMARSGYTAVGPTGPYLQQWHRDLWSESGEQVADAYQPVAVHDSVHNLDLTYVGTTTGSLYAFNLATGATFWRFPAPGQYIGGILSPPTIFNGIVYLASLDGNVYALDGTSVVNGVPAVLWTFSTGRPGGFWGTPVVTSSGVYIGGRDGYVYALNPSTGAKLWEYNVGAPIETSPAYDSGVLYFAAEDMHAYALNASAGTLAWQSPLLSGQTFRGYFPVVTSSLVIFRTAPNDDPHNVLGEGEQVLAYAAGCTDYTSRPSFQRNDIPCFNWKATATSPMSYTVESQAVASYLSGAGYSQGGKTIPGRPQYETFFALQKATGLKAFTAPVLWTAGNTNPGVPPVVDGNGRIWVLYRTYYSDYDEPNWYIMNAFGQMDPSTGALTLRNPNPNPTGYACTQYSCNHAFDTNVWMIGDENTSFSVAGNTLYTNQWSGLGTVNLTNGNLQSVIGYRDAFASALNDSASRSLPFGTTPPDVLIGKGPTIYGNTIVSTYNSIVFAMTGQLPGSNATPLPASTPVPNQTFTPTTAGPVAIPDQASLQHYVWDVPVAMNVDTAGSAGLVSELSDAVSSFLTTGRLAPWLLLPGKTDIDGNFLNPADTEYFLGLAYPYVSPSLQSQIIQFVHADQATTDPINSYYGYSWNDGLTYSNGQVTADPSRLRVPFPPGPSDYCQIQGGCEGFNGNLNYVAIPNAFDRLYDLWFYAYRTGDWSYLATNWGRISSKYEVNQTISAINSGGDSALLGLPTDPANPTNATNRDSANRRLSAILGYTRIAYHMSQLNPTNSTYQAQVSWGVNAATLALQARLRYVNTFRPSDGDGVNPNTSTWTVNTQTQRGGYFLQRFSQTTNIPEYRDMTPEVGKFLADNAFDDFARYAAYIDTVSPTRYLQRGTNNLEGEVLFGHPANTQGIFLADALISRLPGPELEKYLDIPAVPREDMYYIERLARTIEAYGQLGLADSRYPDQPPTLAEYSVTLPVQK